MGIFDNLSDICGAKVKEAKGDFFFSGIGNGGLAIEGKYKIESFNSSEIVLRLNRGRLIKIIGDGLIIGTLAPAEIGISGKILSIEFGGKFCDER